MNDSQNGPCRMIFMWVDRPGGFLLDSAEPQREHYIKVVLVDTFCEPTV